MTDRPPRRPASRRRRAPVVARFGRWMAGLVAVAMLLVAGAARAEGPAPDPNKLQQPVLLNSATLEYPPELLELDPPPEGRVVVQFVVGVDGVPKELKVQQAVHPRLDALAMDAVSKLRYEPGKYDGQPVEIVLNIALDIAAPAPPPEPEPEPNPGPASVEPPPPSPIGPDSDPDGAAPGDGPETQAPLGQAQPDAGPIRLEGVLVEAGQRQPIEGSTILAIPAPDDVPPGRIKKRIYEPPGEPAWQVKTTTDAEGKFQLAGIPSGRVRVVILTDGFQRLEFVEVVPEGEALTVKYFQTRESTNPYRTVVTTSLDEREEVARRTITAEEIGALPGTQGDALKALQNFPGIARSPFAIGLLVIRGSAPTDSATYLGYHEIPQLFHFGGLTSVFNSDILTQIDFIPGNFDSRYGDAIGGVVNVAPRKGRRDGYHGYIDSDLFDTGVMVEGPIGKGSFILSGRRSYIDLLLPVFVPDDAGLDLSIAPRYWDYQALFDYPVSGGNLSVKLFGSDDRTKVVASSPNEVTTDDRNRFESTVWFHRADLAYDKEIGPWKFLVTPSFRYDYFDVAAGDFFSFDLETQIMSTRAEVTRRLSRRSALRVGTEYVWGRYAFTAKAPPVPNQVGSTGEQFVSKDDQFFNIPALYTTLTLGVTDKFTLYPGLRFSYYYGPYNYTTTDPRLRFAWQIADNTLLKGGAGTYSQAPEVVEFDKTFGNPRVGPEHAGHFSLGVAQDFGRGVKLEVTGFYNHQYNLAAPSTKIVLRPDGTVGPENFASTGSGRAFGMEVLARKDLTKNFFGWLSYTLMRSERRDSKNDPFILTNLDQTHILTLIAVYKLPRHWQIGGRFRLVSGNPETPIIGSVYDASSGGYQPVQGGVNSARLPAFHQLDVRVDKKWIYKRVSFTLYLDIQNVYNRQNVEFTNYAFDFSENAPVGGLPIIPSLGLKLEF